MHAKQTLMSASLVAMLGARPVAANAEPAPPWGQRVGEVELQGAGNDGAGAVMLETRAGQPLEVGALERDVGRLCATGRWRQVEAVPSAGPDGDLAVVFLLNPRNDLDGGPRCIQRIRGHFIPAGRFQIGVGFGPDDGFIAAAAVTQDNLFGTGKHLGLSAQLSARQQLFLLRFADPAVLGTDLAATFDLYSHRKVFPGFERQAAGGSLTLSRPLGDHLTGFIGYRLEEVEVTRTLDVAALAGTPLPPLGGGLISAVRAGIQYSTVDLPAMPQRGTRAGVSLELADPRLGSDIQMSRASAWLDHHAPIGPFILHLGGRVSALSSRDPRGVPISERLHFDGAGDVRGFAPGALGPVDPVTGMPLGGELAATGRGELELPVIRSLGISVTGFADIGGLYDRSGAGSLGHSLGFGILWRSPIGPLRFEWAFPMNDPSGKPRFLFGMGVGF